MQEYPTQNIEAQKRQVLKMTEKYDVCLCVSFLDPELFDLDIGTHRTEIKSNGSNSRTYRTYPELKIAERIQAVTISQ